MNLVVLLSNLFLIEGCWWGKKKPPSGLLPGEDGNSSNKWNVTDPYFNPNLDPDCPWCGFVTPPTDAINGSYIYGYICTRNFCTKVGEPGNASAKFDFEDTDNWLGWTAPGGMNASTMEAFEKEFQDMMDAYHKQMGDYGSDVPYDWNTTNMPDDWGDGPGGRGVPPPPWSYVPVVSGKPLSCYYFPSSKYDIACTEELTHPWMYNPFLDQCLQRPMKCYQPQNSFFSRDACERECVGAVEGSCDDDTRIPVEWR